MALSTKIMTISNLASSAESTAAYGGEPKRWRYIDGSGHGNGHRVKQW